MVRVTWIGLTMVDCGWSVKYRLLGIKDTHKRQTLKLGTELSMSMNPG